jgi:alcohol dehydrogenase class IV
MPRALRELGCTAALIPVLAEDALADEVMLNTPRVPSAEQLVRQLQTAL